MDANSLEHKEQNTRADNKDYINIEYRRMWCHHEPAVTAKSVSTREHFPFPSDFSHTQWVI